MNFGSNYKILKYKVKLNEALINDDIKSINKYYSHLKLHTIKSFKGGDGNINEIKYDFRQLDKLLKSYNIKEFEKSSLIQYKDFIIGNKSKEDENNKLLQEYQNNYLLPNIQEYHNKLSTTLGDLIKVGCSITRERNTGVISDKPEYSNQCFWISTIDFLKTHKKNIDIEQIRFDAELADTPKNFDTNFEEGKYLIGAAKVSVKYDLTYVIYNTDTANNKIINSPYGVHPTEMRIIGSGKNIVIISSQNNAHFELITSIKCDDTDMIDTTELIWSKTTSTLTSSSNTQQAREKIGNIIKKNREKIRAKFLNTVCSDSNECISFGKEIKIIKEFFGNFANFDYVKEYRQLGTPSVNGFIKGITYEKQGYIANTVLKSSREDSADNLYYEYLVGKFLNTQSMFFPCFVETYQIFKYKDYATYAHILHCNTTADCEVQKLKDGLEVYSNTDIETGIRDSCINPRSMAVLIQSLKNPFSIEDMLKDTELTNKQLLYVLFQIYMPLSMIANKFTHYDLHWNNVQLYEPVKDKVIKYYYHLSSTEIIEFYSPYIAKIIDYGRCYFNDGTNNSVNIYMEVCKINECGKIFDTVGCGADKGYAWLDPVDIHNNKYNIKSAINNPSYDLQLLAIVLPKVNQTSNLLPLKSLLKWDTKFKSSDGTNINNVNDAVRELKKIILQQANKDANNNYYGTKDLIGELHIYADGTPIEFKEKK